MSLISKIINIYIFLISIIIISSNQKNTLLEYCDIDKYCSSCTLCGNETNDYTLCSYYNIFCSEKYTNRTNFQELYIKKYSVFFRNIQNSNEFCGQEMYRLDSIKNSFLIMKKSNKKIKTSSINHCNYEIQNVKYFNNQLDIANLIIKFNSNNYEKNNMKLIFNILLKNSHSKLSKLTTINEMDLIKNNYKITLNDYDTIIILLDFDFKNETDIDGYLEIRIDINNSGNKMHKINKRVNILLIVIFSILGVSIFTIINFIYYRRKQNRNIKIQKEFFQQEEFKRKQKEEKINKLFETILILKEFNQNDITNNCTECAICIEKFIDKYLICITPCKHIFHYECLSNFIESIKGKKNPIIKCPLCQYDFLEEENGDKRLNKNNNNENNNKENNMRQINLAIISQIINVNYSSHLAASKENLRKPNV